MTEERLTQIKNDLNRVKAHALQKSVESDMINGVDVAIAVHPSSLPQAWQYVNELLNAYLGLKSATALKKEFEKGTLFKNDCVACDYGLGSHTCVYNT